MILSIIIPVYNTEKYLEDCIKSIFEQNIPEEDFEVILVNDGSTDNSLEICNFLSKKHSNIRVFNQENKGQSIARNVGINASIGKYIYFIDSDDHLKTGYLNLFLNILEKDKLDFLGFTNYNTTERYITKPNTEPLELKIQGDGLSIISQHFFYNGPCWYIFSKKLIENLYFEEGRLCEDVLFTTQLLLRVTNGHIYKNKVYGYYANNESTLRTKNTERFQKLNDDMFHVAEKFSEIIDNIDFKKNVISFQKLRERQESYTYFGIIRFIKSQRKYSILNDFLHILKLCKYSGYPIKNFKGYNHIDRILIKCFNKKFFLYSVILLNRTLKLVKQ